ncbi:DNA-formamidopyrimidine glycosylase family protein [Nocardioides jiangxiensis]|uniref:DNA-(apurinic or apyrimidinic site) lyase n=1 Tax=Nocardioides jiangxiensis TaxID=3064524 RepID=A0ABT9B131_9ACTN|nr:DNA-formamidopyrimidine glycosylase family protein [Nocardioides sp. WY-20]MDO7866986.1 DNA-formamidopyrimidine glycosylase family protein [Nocardioides sp. WY-20]
MPEGDAVWRAARSLDRALSGRVLTSTDFRVPAHATADLSGRTVVETVARGKHLLTRIGPDVTLHTHLKMEGSWAVGRAGERWRKPAHTARVVLRTDDVEAVGFSLGIVELLPRAAESDAVGHLGPDLLGPDWDAARAAHNLVGDPDRPLAEALLDQRNLAGIGNVYAAELCFLTGRLPTTPVGEVERLERLVSRAHQLLLVNRERSGMVTTGDTRRGRSHWVYGQRTCLRCGSVVRREEQGEPGRERIRYWCPSCQR